MDNDVRNQLNRIEVKIDELTNLLHESISVVKHRRHISRPKSYESNQKGEISLEELNARLDRL